MLPESDFFVSRTLSPQDIKHKASPDKRTVFINRWYINRSDKLNLTNEGINIIEEIIDDIKEIALNISIKSIKDLLNNEKTHLLDGSESLGIYKPAVKNTKVVKEKIKKIRRIVKELKKI